MRSLFNGWLADCYRDQRGSTAYTVFGFRIEPLVQTFDHRRLCGQERLPWKPHNRIEIMFGHPKGWSRRSMGQTRGDPLARAISRLPISSLRTILPCGLRMDKLVRRACLETGLRRFPKAGEMVLALLSAGAHRIRAFAVFRDFEVRGGPGRPGQALSYLACSASRSARRLILPDDVSSKASTNSISRGAL